jgi:NAD(P) transhydrogenase subunit alpha
VASGVPYHASQMYARNVSAFLLHLVKDQKLAMNMDDEIVRETLLTLGGEVLNPRVREFFGMPGLVVQG